MATTILWVTAALLSWVMGVTPIGTQYKPPADLGLSPVGLQHKESRLIFGNPDCVYQAKLGTCYGSVECLMLAGSFGNFCGLPGLCCLFYRSCGMRTSQKFAYFRNEQYPLSGRVDESCVMNIVKRSDEFCAVRVKMKEANFPKPTRSGMCKDASYIVSGTRNSNITPKCGDLTGNSYTYDMRHTDEVRLTINSTTLRSGINWDMEVHQIPCSEYNSEDPMEIIGDGAGSGSGTDTSTITDTGTGTGSGSGTGSGTDTSTSTGTGTGTGSGSGTGSGTDTSTSTGTGSGTDFETGDGGPTGPVYPPGVQPPGLPPTTTIVGGSSTSVLKKCGVRGIQHPKPTRSRDDVRRLGLLGPLGPDMLHITGRRKNGYPRPGQTFRRRRRPQKKKSPEDSVYPTIRQEVIVTKIQANAAITTDEWGVPDLTDTLFGHYMGDRSVFSNRITYGRLAGTSEFPWQVAITVNGKFHCGACIIGTQWILTAAHCVIGYEKTPTKLDLTVGDWDLSTVNDGPDKKVVAQNITVHSAYSRSTLQNDVALVKLTSTLEYTDDIKPICLSTTNLDIAGRQAVVSGWGRNENKTLEPQLHFLEAKVLSNVICDSRWHAQGAPRTFIVDSMMCMDSTSGDSCNGDSGGPSVMEEPEGSKNYVLVGLVSFGSGSCVDESLPGVYTRVGHYLKWIAENMV